MPRTNFDPHFGAREKARFDLENPPPLSKHSYDAQRAAKYPNLAKGEFPPGSHESYDRYKEIQRDTDIISRSYRDEREAEEQFMQTTDEMPREYYKATSDRIRPAVHKSLAGLAERGTHSHFDQAVAREDYIRRFPLGYTQYEKRMQHHEHVRTHYKDSDGCLKSLETHRKFASAHPPTSKRDLFGNEPTRDYKPYELPLPPYFPPKDHYSVNRGVDTQSESSGGGWSEVPSSSSGVKDRRRGGGNRGRINRGGRV